ncbi:hypothetical protein MUO14_21370 [Halobacillus shinanisalinarum]|uniref:Uncharacterized protein n=1 Tax=Halobacillus shinanisalinarum TaxID=2932258 RepID=A0ABY4GXK5_9BACI|nr:hypothetical protein [Halobacillus shinanisalinarum]UOQ92922.1 hypothetical protein MUO14_21370 [Halobacillus shinanisalinarum]
MWDNIMGRFPINMILFCTILSFVIPIIIVKANQILHHYGDPPWKKNKGTVKDKSNES